MIDEDPTLPHATGVMRSFAWRTAGFFFLLPGAVVLCKSGLPANTMALAGAGCALGVLFLVTRGWPTRRARLDMAIPALAALYLYALNALSGWQALNLWEIVLWYSAGIMWVGLNQPLWCLATTPLFGISAALSTGAPLSRDTLAAVSVTLGVMTMIAGLIALQLGRGRRAYFRLQRGVARMTTVAGAGRVPARDRPSEIHDTTAEAAVDLGYLAAGVVRVVTSRKKWEIRAWSGQRPSDVEWGQLGDCLVTAAEQERTATHMLERGPVACIPMLRNPHFSYVLVAQSGDEVEDGQHQALELLAAQTSRGLEILRMAFYDQLTGLPNRHLFQERLAEQIAAVRADSGSFGLMFMDIDRFKTVNDLYGHAVGDRFLAELASRLRHGVRGLDYVSQRQVVTSSRLGGDEFAVLLPELKTERDAENVAKRLDDLLSRPFTIGGREISTHPSIGVVLSHPRYTEPSQMMRDADTAMYQAKLYGGAHWAVFDTEMRTTTERRLELERSLVGALDRGEFRLQYQPIVETVSRHPVGFEALSRWTHPTLGEIPPGEFISIAEATGAIDVLGRFVVRSAINALAEWNRRWPQNPPLYVTANISRKQIGDGELLQEIEAALHTTGLNPSQLVVEITESMALADRDRTRDYLLAMRQLGIRLALDDFGTGYSALSCLHEMPVQLLKLDREFAAAAHQSERALRTVDGAVRMAHAMGLHVVAEGVEEQAHMQVMGQVCCDLVQGFLISRPLEHEAVTQWLDHHTVLERDAEEKAER